MRRLQLLFLATGAALGTFSPFVAVILQAHGLGVTAIGLVVALGAVATTVAVPAWGHLGDRILGRSRALQIAAILSIVVALVLGGPIPALAFAAMVVLLTPFQATFLSFADALAVNAMSDARQQYGRIRYLSSLSYAVVATIVGFVFDRTGYGAAPFLFAALALVLAFVAGEAPDVARVESTKSPGSTPRFGSVGLALHGRPRLWAVLVSIVLVYLGVIAGWTFLTLRITELGGQPSDVALSMGVGAFAEIPGMLLAGRVASRIGLRGLFVASALLYGICFASWIVLDSPALIIATRLACGIALAGLWVSSVLTMATLLPDRLQATGQALYQVTVFGVAATAANLGGGWIYGSAGHAALFAVAVVGAAASVLVAWFAVPRRGEEVRLARMLEVAGLEGPLEVPL